MTCYTMNSTIHLTPIGRDDWFGLSKQIVISHDSGVPPKGLVSVHSEHSGVVTSYSVEKLCLEWLKTFTLSQVKQHLSLLSEDMDLRDFLLGPQKPCHKHFLYAIYNELWKISQQEAAERLCEIDRIK